MQQKFGFCDNNLHRPGKGVLFAVQAYLKENKDTIPLQVKDPRKEDEEDVKSRARNELAEKIAKAMNDKGGLLRERGYLYCYRNKADGIAVSKDLTQRPLKCGKAQESNWPARYNTQRTHYDGKGEEIQCVACIRVPFITQVDSYVKQRLDYWKLPSRAAEGGTEWHYISLQRVKAVWREAKTYAIEEGRKYGLQDDAWYEEQVALPY